MSKREKIVIEMEKPVRSRNTLIEVIRMTKMICEML